MARFTTAGLVLALVVVLAGTATAGTVDLTATADAMLFSGSYANTNYGSDVNLGVYWGSARQKSIFLFDLDSFSSGATVTSATLTLYVNGHGNPWDNSNEDPMDLYRITESWDEDSVTWNKRSGTTSWGATGGSYVGTKGTQEKDYYATTSMSVDSADDPVTWDVSDLVQEWVDGTSDNHGLAIMSRSSSDFNQMHFHSLENVAGVGDPADYDPSDYYATLTVTVVPLPGAGFAGLGLMAVLGAVAALRRRRIR